MPLGDNPGDRYNALMAFGDIGSKVSGALLKMAEVKDQREQRALTTSQNAAQMALNLQQIETDHQNSLAAYRKGGWSGMPGQNVGAPAVSPATRSLIDEAYPGNDFSMTGAGLMDSSVEGYGQPSVYDREKDRTLPQPTYTVNKGDITGTNILTPEDAIEIQEELPDEVQNPSFAITYDSDGYPQVTSSGIGTQAEAQEIANSILATDTHLAGGKERLASNLAYLTNVEGLDPYQMEYLRNADPEYIQSFIASHVTDTMDSNKPRTAGEPEKRALIQYKTANIGVEMLRQLITETGGSGIEAGMELLLRPGFWRTMGGTRITQAQHNFLAAADLIVGSTLRVTSGAAIGEQEIQNKRAQLMPLPGEGIDVQMRKLSAMFEQVREINHQARIAGGDEVPAYDRTSVNPFLMDVNGEYSNIPINMDGTGRVPARIQGRRTATQMQAYGIEVPAGFTEEQVMDSLFAGGLTDEEVASAIEYLFRGVQ